MCDQLVNTDVVTTAIHVPMVFPTGADELLTISEIGELSASAIDQLQLFELETQLTKNQRNDYRYYWIRLRGENNPIRTIVNGITISQSIDFYDRFVIANLSRQRFRDIIRVIDETVSNYPFAPSWWYRHRIDYLVSKGSVVFKPGSPDIVESQIGKIKLKQ